MSGGAPVQPVKTAAGFCGLLVNEAAGWLPATETYLLVSHSPDWEATELVSWLLVRQRQSRGRSGRETENVTQIYTTLLCGV